MHGQKTVFQTTVSFWPFENKIETTDSLAKMQGQKIVKTTALDFSFENKIEIYG